MVHVRDEGSRFDGSIETVWRYLNNPELHGQAHKETRNRTAKTEGGLTTRLSMERNWKGAWVKVSFRVTVLPPLGYVAEYTEGPFAGSNTFTVFTPIDSSHTQIDVYGEFKSPTIPEAELEAAARLFLDSVYNDDAPAIKTLQTSP
jgi:hypothetical protein